MSDNKKDVTLRALILKLLLEVNVALAKDATSKPIPAIESVVVITDTGDVRMFITNVGVVVSLDCDLRIDENISDNLPMDPHNDTARMDSMMPSLLISKVGGYRVMVVSANRSVNEIRNSQNWVNDAQERFFCFSEAVCRIAQSAKK